MTVYSLDDQIISYVWVISQFGSERFLGHYPTRRSFVRSCLRIERSLKDNLRQCTAPPFSSWENKAQNERLGVSPAFPHFKYCSKVDSNTETNFVEARGHPGKTLLLQMKIVVVYLLISTQGWGHADSPTKIIRSFFQYCFWCSNESDGAALLCSSCRDMSLSRNYLENFHINTMQVSWQDVEQWRALETRAVARFCRHFW